jgi:hypothetical protein
MGVIAFGKGLVLKVIGLVGRHDGWKVRDVSGVTNVMARPWRGAFARGCLVRTVIGRSSAAEATGIRK